MFELVYFDIVYIAIIETFRTQRNILYHFHSQFVSERKLTLLQGIGNDIVCSGNGLVKLPVREFV